MQDPIPGSRNGGNRGRPARGQRAWPLVIALVLVAALGAASAGAPGVLPGPIAARLVRVVDGDTIVVRAYIWLDQEVEVRVRLAGIDAPELRGRCAAERARAERARDRVAAALASGEVTLRDIRYGKYAGRVLARVLTAAGRDLGAVLLAEGLARAYAGRARGSWCGQAQLPG